MMTYSIDNDTGNYFQEGKCWVLELFPFRSGGEGDFEEYLLSVGSVIFLLNAGS